jgi:hypothetical protein
VKKSKSISVKHKSAVSAIIAQPTALPLPPFESSRFTIPESLAFLKISRASLYKSIAAKKVNVVHHGRKVFLSGAEIMRLASESA